MRGWWPSRVRFGGYGGRLPQALRVGMALGVLLAGLGGCNAWFGRSPDPQTPEELEAELAKRQEKLKKEEKKPDYQVYSPLVAPYPTPGEKPQEPDPRRDRRLPIKPGHWTTLGIPVQANAADLLGDLQLAAVLNPRGEASGLGPMAYWLRSLGMTAVPKGQTRICESPLFLPPAGSEPWVAFRLADRELRRELFANLIAVERMPPYQYHFVVLARNPEQYGFLAGLDSFRYPLDLSQEGDDRRVLRTILLAGDRPNSLPAGALYWTSIAGVLWDEAHPGALAPAQQQALLDWLHWGGQLVVSGPGSLDLLKGSFLAPYLPATSTGSYALGADELRALDAGWSPRGRDGVVRALRPVRPWPAVRLAKHPEARFIPQTGDLLAERRAGRGRIVVSAFALSTRDLGEWAGYDGLMNACLLGRPPRRFRRTTYGLISSGLLQAGWEDRPLDTPAANLPGVGTASGPGMIRAEDLLERSFFAESPLQLDPLRICRLWYLSRDGGRVEAVGSVGQPASPPPVVQPSDLPSKPPPPPDPWCWFDASQQRLRGCGVAGWSDFNPLADAARRALQNAARIEIPDARFVLWVVGIYLVLLVPANYAVFRLLGRLEWAWFAVPALALAGSAVIIRLARLDIGFERSVTEIALVELQSNYPRAHVTRYTALYTGLYTEYTIHFEDPGAQILPFPTVAHPQKFDPEQSPRPVEVSFRSDPRGATLKGFAVASNSTNLLHSEQMLDLGGAIRAEWPSQDRMRITNGTDYHLRGVGVLRWESAGPGSGAAVFRTAIESEQGPRGGMQGAGPPTPGPPRLWGPAKDGTFGQSPPTPSSGPPAAAQGVAVAEATQPKLVRAGANPSPSWATPAPPDKHSPVPGASVVQAAWVGDLRPGQTAEVQLAETPGFPMDRAWRELRDQHELTAGRPGRGPAAKLNLRELIDLATAIGLQPGETRLVAWLDQPMPGEEILPAAPRIQQAAVLVAHLGYGFDRDPRPDTVPRTMVDEVPPVLRSTKKIRAKD